MKRILIVLTILALPFHAKADADLLERLVGYTIVASKTIAGYQENDKRSDNFEGCSHGRVIIFTDNRILTCATYSYSYSYRPKAIILSDGSSFKMIVGNNIYDMRR